MQLSWTRLAFARVPWAGLHLTWAGLHLTWAGLHLTWAGVPLAGIPLARPDRHRVPLTHVAGYSGCRALRARLLGAASLLLHPQVPEVLAPRRHGWLRWLDVYAPGALGRSRGSG